MKHSRSFRPDTFADLAALLICLAAFFSTLWTANRVFENLPHLEDEMAYVWEAKAIAGGHFWFEAPDCSRCYLVPFVVDYQGRRFGKYPLAWPAALSLGISLGIRSLVNPLLGAFSAWLTYRLGKKLFHPLAGVIAALLTAASPFFIMNTSSLLSHTWGVFLTLVFVIGWLDAFFPRLRSARVPAALPAACAAGALGLLALSRPLTAASAALPFAIHGLVLLVKGSPPERRLAVAIGLGAGLLASLHLVWQYALTGNPFLNPYTLWWSYDRVGFGPGTGLQEGGYSLLAAYVNTRFSLSVLSHDLFGWPALSFIFLPFGLWAGRRSLPAWLLTGLIPSIIAGYGLYWISSWLFGPRYYFETLPAFTILTAAGLCWLAGLPAAHDSTTTHGSEITAFLERPWFRRLRMGFVLSAAALLISASMLYYIPMRLKPFHGLYGVAGEHIQPFLRPEAEALTPALVIVHKQYTWYEYGTLLDLESPYLDTPFVFIYDPSPEEEARIIQQFPGRTIIHYYADEPYRFYLHRRG